MLTMNTLLTQIIVLATIPLLIAAAPAAGAARTISMPLTRRVASQIVDPHIIQTVEDYALHPESHISGEGNTTDIDARQDIVKRAPRRGASQLRSHNDVLWLGTVVIDGKEYSGAIDTGSSDLTFCGPNCLEAISQGRNIIDAKKGKSIQNLEQPFSAEFLGGSSISGGVYTADVEIGGLQVTKQVFGIATTMNVFSSPAFSGDGLIGLGFPALSHLGQPPLLQTLFEQGQISETSFTLLMRSGQCYSELSFGPVKKTLYTGKITWVPVIQMMYWRIQMSSFSLNGEVILGPMNIILDSATTYILGDARRVTDLHKAIPGFKPAPDTFEPGRFTIPCESIPRASLEFGEDNTSFDLLPDDFSLGPIAEDGVDCITSVAISPSDAIGKDFWVVGQVFFNNILATFRADPANPAVGIAKAAPASSLDQECAQSASVPIHRTDSRSSSQKCRCTVM